MFRSRVLRLNSHCDTMALNYWTGCSVATLSTETLKHTQIHNYDNINIPILPTTYKQANFCMESYRPLLHVVPMDIFLLQTMDKRIGSKGQSPDLKVKGRSKVMPQRSNTIITMIDQTCADRSQTMHVAF